MQETMRNPRLVIAATILGAAAILGQVSAQDPTKDVVTLDFTNAAVASQVKVNGDAKFVTEGGKQRLRMTDATSQAASVFFTTPINTSNYLATFDFQVTHVPDDTADPADGFMFLAQTFGPDKIGTAGNALGFARTDAQHPPLDEDMGGFVGYNYGVEFNSWPENGLPNAPQTVGLDILGVRERFNQTAFPHVDLGTFTAQVRVTPDLLTVTVSGGTANLKPTVILTSPKWMVGFFNPPAPLYFGFTAGTGGAQQVVDLFNLNIKVPPAE